MNRFHRVRRQLVVTLVALGLAVSGTPGGPAHTAETVHVPSATAPFLIGGVRGPTQGSALVTR